MADDEYMVLTNYGPLGFSNDESVPGAAPRGALSDRSWAHWMHATEQEDEESNQRELDLWLLESQVPGCTRERAESAYEQGQQDVSRALPLARMATLLSDHACMAEFLMEQLPGSTYWEASTCFDASRGDIVEAAVALHDQTQRRLNQPVLSARGKERLRIRTVFMLALLYRDRYGQLEPEAEQALAQVPTNGRLRSESLPSFRTPDGSVWTHTRGEGWERRAPLTPASLGRAVRATEQLAVAAQARGDAETAHRARQTAADLQARLDNDDDDDNDDDNDDTPVYRGDIATTGASAPALRRSDEQARLDNGPTNQVSLINDMQRARTRFRESQRWLRVLQGPLPNMRNHGPEELERWHDWHAENDLSDADDDGDNDRPPTLAAESSSSTDEEDDDDENEAPTAGTYARPRPYVRSVARVHPQEAFSLVAKRQLRILQEQLDTEMANAAQGVVMGEGAYLAMMNAVKVLWEAVGPQPAELN